MYLSSVSWGSVFVSMYAEIRNDSPVAVAYFGRVTEKGVSVSEKVFASRADMRKWVNTSAKFELSSK